jgi:hypothetical protein
MREAFCPVRERQRLTSSPPIPWRREKEGKDNFVFSPVYESLTHVLVMWHAYVDSQVGWGESEPEYKSSGTKLYLSRVGGRNWPKANHPVRLAYRPPATSTFLSEQTSHNNQPTVLFSHNKSASVTSYQPNEQAE